MKLTIFTLFIFASTQIKAEEKIQTYSGEAKIADSCMPVSLSGVFNIAVKFSIDGNDTQIEIVAPKVKDGKTIQGLELLEYKVEAAFDGGNFYRDHQEIDKEGTTAVSLSGMMSPDRKTVSNFYYVVDFKKDGKDALICRIELHATELKMGALNSIISTLSNSKTNTNGIDSPNFIGPKLPPTATSTNEHKSFRP